MSNRARVAKFLEAGTSLNNDLFERAWHSKAGSQGLASSYRASDISAPDRKARELEYCWGTVWARPGSSGDRA